VEDVGRASGRGRSTPTKVRWRRNHTTDSSLILRRRMRDRHEEVAFIVGFFNVLRIDWLASTRNATRAQWRALFRLLGTSSSEIRRIEQTLTEDEEEPDILIPLALWELTRWICSLELPTDLPHLCRDPPVLKRTRPPRATSRGDVNR
jgi:hypothetical protein